jgi:hypothetical protein
MVVDHHREIQVHSQLAQSLELMQVRSIGEAVGSQPYRRSAQSGAELKL